MNEGKPHYHVFLSHNSRDKAAVEPLAVLLREKGLNPFLDKWNLLPGEPIEDALIEALENSDSAVIFVGPGGDGPWQSEEMRDILKRAVKSHNEFRAIPVLLPNASAEALEKTFLGSRLWIEFKDVDDDDALLRLAKAIQGEAYGDESFKLPDEPAPYRGLERFERIEKPEEDFFFGRDDEIRALVERLVKERFIAVVGASGSGKSSLIRAGLTKQLAEEIHPGIRRWQTITVEPGSAPFRALAVQIAVAAGIGVAEREDWIEKSVPKWRASADGVRQSLETLFADAREPLLVFIDQFEELFTHGKKNEEHERITRNFVANLDDLWRNGGDRVRVVVAMRADFIDRCLEIGALKELLQDRTMLIGEVGDDALREIVKEPAARVGAFLEKGLMERILTDVHNQSGSLPLLEQALHELWRQRRGAWLTHDAYDDSGGVAGALNDQAQGAYKALDDAQKKIADCLFPRLITLGEGVADTRRRVRRNELYPEGVEHDAVNAVIDKLSGKDARILVTTREGGTAEDIGAGEDFVEFTHEALLGNWDHLKKLLASERESIRKHRVLTSAAQEWESKPEDEREKFLLRAGQLVIAEQWADEGGYARLNQQERRFLDESIQELIAEEARKARTARRLKLLSIGAIAAALIMGVLGVVMYGQWQDGLKSESLFLADLARQQTNDGDAVTAALLALEGLKDKKSNNPTQYLRPHVPVAEGALDTASQPGTWRDGVFKDGSVRVMDYMEDQNWDGRIVTTSDDRTAATVWATGAEGKWTTIARLSHENERLDQFYTSPDGRRIVTTSGVPEPRLWNAASGQQIAVLKGHTRNVERAAFSPDGTHIVTVSFDETARLWNAEDGKEIAVLEGHKNYVTSAVFSRDGLRIVTTSEDGTARVWSAGGDGTWTETAVILHEERGVNIAVSPDGRRIVTTSGVEPRLWNAASGQQIAVLKGHTGIVLNAAFSPNGTRIVTASEDNTARLWNAFDGKEIAVLEGHTGIVLNAAFSPNSTNSTNSTHIITASVDTTARLWDAFYGKQITALKHTKAVLNAAFSPDGTRIVTLSLSYPDFTTARMWEKVDAKSGNTEVSKLRYNTWTAFSGNGTRMVTRAEDGGTVLVYEVGADGTWTEVTRLSHGNSELTGFVLSHDGTHIVTNLKDETARVWEGGADGTWISTVPFSLGEARLIGVAVSPNGIIRIVTTSGDGTALIWATSADGTWSPIDRLPRGDNELTDIAISPDGTLIVTIARTKALVWEAGTGAKITSLPARGQITSVVFSPDSTRIVTVSEELPARLWNAANGAEYADLWGHAGNVRSAAFSPDGTRIVTASEDTTARLWNATDGKPITVLEGHTGNVRSAAFSPDGTRIVTASEDTTARLWHAATGKQVTALKHTEAVINAAFSRDGKRIVTTSEDDETAWVWVWDAVRTQTLIDRSKKNVSRCLTEKQRQQFHLAPTAPRWCYTMAKWPYHKDAPPPRWYEQPFVNARKWILRVFKDM